MKQIAVMKNRPITNAQPSKKEEHEQHRDRPEIANQRHGSRTRGIVELKNKTRTRKEKLVTAPQNHLKPHQRNNRPSSQNQSSTSLANSQEPVIKTPNQRWMIRSESIRSKARSENQRANSQNRSEAENQNQTILKAQAMSRKGSTIGWGRWPHQDKVWRENEKRSSPAGNHTEKAKAGTGQGGTENSDPKRTRRWRPQPQAPFKNKNWHRITWTENALQSQKLTQLNRTDLSVE